MFFPVLARSPEKGPAGAAISFDAPPHWVKQAICHNTSPKGNLDQLIVLIHIYWHRDMRPPLLHSPSCSKMGQMYCFAAKQYSGTIGHLSLLILHLSTALPTSLYGNFIKTDLFVLSVVETSDQKQMTNWTM
jgi:hypothetical protein